MWTQKPSFRFEIDNFSEKKGDILSPTFVSGGCEWYLYVYPKGNSSAENHLSLYLGVANRNSLRNGWKRSVQYVFVVLNQSDKELYRYQPKAGRESTLFSAENFGWGCRKALHLSKLQEEGSLENDKLIIEVYINVLEAVDGEGEKDVSKKNETVEINGFQVLVSRVTSVRKLFAEHPDIAEDFKSNNKAVKTAYMNVLLKLVEKIEKSPESLLETKLTKASSKLSELMDVGFKLGWLKSKLDEISSEKKKLDDESRVQKIEERIKNLEGMKLGFKFESLKTKIDEVTLEWKKADADGCLFQQLDKRVKNLELDETSSKVEDLKTELDDLTTELDGLRTELETLNTKIDEFTLESDDDDDESWNEQLEERVKNLELMDLGSKFEFLNTKLDEVTLEMNKEDEDEDEDESWGEQLEERVGNLEAMDFGSKIRSLETKLNEVSLEGKKENSRAQKIEELLRNLELRETGKFEFLKRKLDEVSFRSQQFEERLKNLEIMEPGLKFESLKTKLDELSLDRKKERCRVQGLEEHIKNVEMKLGLNVGSLRTKLDEMEMVKVDDDAWDEQLEERVNNLEAMDLEYKLDCLKSKHESRVQKLEESIKKLGMMELGLGSKVDCLNTKLEQVSVERKKSDNAEESRIQNLEDSVHDIRLMFSYLKAELNKKKDKSSDDGFLLVE